MSAAAAFVPPGATGVRIEVDGRVVARTDVAPGELVADVEARLAEAWTEVLEEPSPPSSARELGDDGVEPERRCSARRASDKPARCGRVAKYFDELGLPVCGLHRPRRSS